MYVFYSRILNPGVLWLLLHCCTAMLLYIYAASYAGYCAAYAAVLCWMCCAGCWIRCAVRAGCERCVLDVLHVLCVRAVCDVLNVLYVLCCFLSRHSI